VTLTRAMTGLALGSLTLAGLRQAYSLQVECHALHVPKLRDAVRVVQLTDLHFGQFIRRASVRGWVNAALAQTPDLIVITGDLLDARGGTPRSELLAELARLRAPLGVWATWGNHDHRCLGDRLPQFREELGRVGVRVLVNEGARVRGDLFVAGVDDLLTARPDVTRALQGRPSDSAALLLSHHPNVSPGARDDVQLTLYGHTHGGQITPPGVRFLVRHTPFGARFFAGFTPSPSLGYVSRGLGVTFIPLRLGSAPELTVLDLAPLVEGD